MKLQFFAQQLPQVKISNCYGEQWASDEAWGTTFFVVVYLRETTLSDIRSATANISFSRTTILRNNRNRTHSETQSGNCCLRSEFSPAPESVPSIWHSPKSPPISHNTPLLEWYFLTQTLPKPHEKSLLQLFLACCDSFRL